MITALKPEVEKALSTPGLTFQSTTVDLKRAAALLARISDRRSSMPMLQNVVMRVLDRSVVLAATDLNVFATITLDLVPGTEREQGGFCVNAKALSDLVKSLPPAEVTIKRHGQIGLSVSVGNVASVLHGLPDRDFPKIPDAADLPWHDVKAETLGNAIDSVAFSVCKDETRFT